MGAYYVPSTLRGFHIYYLIDLRNYSVRALLLPFIRETKIQCQAADK